MKPKSRREAITQGAPYYNTGAPCRRGHIADRYASEGSCIECANERAAKRYLDKKPEILKRLKDQYASDPEKYRAKVKRQAAENPEVTKASRKREYEKNKDSYLKRAAKWQTGNPEAARARGQRWRAKHPIESYQNALKRRMLRLKRTPAWLTGEDKGIINLIYRIAARVTRETGIKYQVDHIIPLRGELVSGLHTPENLQLLTAFDNRSKSNHYSVM